MPLMRAIQSHEQIFNMYKTKRGNEKLGGKGRRGQEKVQLSTKSLRRKGEIVGSPRTTTLQFYLNCSWCKARAKAFKKAVNLMGKREAQTGEKK